MNPSTWDTVCGIVDQAKKDEIKGSVPLEAVVPLERDEFLIRLFHDRIVVIAKADGKGGEVLRSVLCVGTLIMDIINAKVDHLPEESECVTAAVSMNFGGSAFSMSVNLRRLATQDLIVTCYGPVGQDELGDLFENRLKREGVICCLDRIRDKKTSCNMILQEKDKDRRYIFDEGANASASKEKVLAIINQVKPDVLVLGEVPSLGLVGMDLIEIIDYAKQHYHSLVYLDLLVTAEESYGWLADHWHQIDIIHCNYGEGAHITGNETAPEICAWFG
jgi:sugar/nucleoside kinase (ribokinase family)